MKSEKIHHFSRFTDRGPLVVERVIETVRNILKKPVFLKGNADWLSELPYVFKECNNSYHNSIKMTHNQASRKSNEKEVYSSLRDDRVKQNPN